MPGVIHTRTHSNGSKTYQARLRINGVQKAITFKTEDEARKYLDRHEEVGGISVKDLIRLQNGEVVIGKDMIEMLGSSPLVYIAENHEGRALYVGKSVYGISRPFQRTHHRRDQIINAYKIRLVRCGTEEEALAKEIELIKKLKPEYNRETVRERKKERRRLSRRVTE